jgi:hypothetical protein
MAANLSLMTTLTQPSPRSVNLRDEVLARYFGSFVAFIGLPWRQFDLNRDHIPVRNLLDEVGDAIEPRVLLVVGVHNIPRSLLSIGVGEHRVLRFGVVYPVSAGFDIHRAQFPPFNRITHPLLETLLLLFVIHREPIFDDTAVRLSEEERRENPLVSVASDEKWTVST